MDHVADGAGPDARFPSPGIFALLLIVCVFLLRIPGALYPHEWSVDESQMLSQGMKLRVDPVPWRSMDGTSGGPVNSYLITLLLLLGIKPGYLLVHWLASVLVCLNVLLAYLTLLRLSSRFIAAWIVMPVAITYGFAYAPALLHYSSELLPTLLLGCGFYSLTIWCGRPRVLLLFWSGIAVGTSIWCKLQALPVAATLSLTTVWIVFQTETLSGWRARLTHASAYAAGALLPACVILATVAQAGAGRDFWYSYVLQNVAYAGGESWRTTANDAFRWFEMLPLQPLLPVCLFAVLAFFWRSPNQYSDVRRQDRRLMVALAMYMGAALLAISRPATLFLHYANFLLFPAACLAGIAIANATPRSRRTWFVISALIAVVPISLQALCYYTVAMRSVRGDSTTDSNERIARVFVEIRQTRRVASLAIWGWAPGVYVLTGIPPATRDSIGHFVISPGPLQRYFRRRFVSDLRQQMPDVFIDAVASGAFLWTWSVADGYESDPELRLFVDKNYELVNQLELAPGPKKVRFFLRR